VNVEPVIFSSSTPWSQTPTPHGAEVARKRARDIRDVNNIQINDTVSAKWGRSWYQAIVLKVNHPPIRINARNELKLGGVRYKVVNNNEWWWVGRTQIRPM
jgi:sRNA-binding protein